MTFMTGPDDEVVAAAKRMRAARQARGGPRQYTTFRHRDLLAVMKAAKKAGWENVKLTVDKSGTISVVPMTPGESAEPKGANEWDEVLKRDD